MNFQMNDLISFTTHGLFFVETIESISGSADKFYILQKMNSHSQTKTFVSLASAKKDGLRKVINSSDLANLTSAVQNWDATPFERKMNCVEKVSVMNKMIVQEGFAGAVKAHKMANYDLVNAKKEDKKVKEFNTRLKTAILEELSVCNSCSLTEAEQELYKLLNR
jgi:RNA polymerase-interacting CarD/CdnL/TRCF family regulator